MIPLSTGENGAEVKKTKALLPLMTSLRVAGAVAAVTVVAEVVVPHTVLTNVEVVVAKAANALFGSAIHA